MSRHSHLIEEILAVSQECNPNYTREQHLAWALGYLATVVLEKNHMDSIVYSRLNHRLNQLIDRHKYQG